MNRRGRFIINTLYFAIIIGIVFLVFRYLINLISPFFFAFLFSFMLVPVIRWLTIKCHWKHNLSVAVCLIVFFALAGGLLLWCAVNLVSIASDLMVQLPTLYTDYIDPALRNFVEGTENLANRISPELYAIVADALPDIISSIGTAATNLAGKLVSLLSGWATKLPGRLLSLIICCIATVFLTADFNHISSFILRQFPERPRHVILQAKSTFVDVIIKYGKSYGLIMVITFGEIFLGLLLLHQKHAALIALLIAVFDIFPIVGAGLILFPWALVTLLNGVIGKGIGLLLLWIVVIIVRQIIEPRIVGHQVGLHPIVTLMAMFIGSKLFGGLGLLGLPIGCAIIKSLDDTGVIHLMKKAEPEPEPAAVTPEEPEGKK